MLLRTLGAAVALCALAFGAQAAYPEKPITMLVAYPAGGGTDITARAIAPYIEKNLGAGARIVVTNKAGANGEIGFTALSQAAPDGYTIGFINTPALQTNPIERQVKYTLDGFDLIANIIDDPGAFVVHPASDIKDLKGLQEYAKANPGAVTVGSTGIGSDDHLSLMLFERQAGVKMTHVPFPGSAPNKTALLGRHIGMSSVNIGEAKQAGPDVFRVLAVMADKRWEGAADIPPFREQGFDVISSSLRGIAAPKGLPADILQKLRDAVMKAANDPEFQAKAAQTFQPLRILAADVYGAELKKMDTELRALWQAQPWK